jgi:hypothetical protein
LSDIGFDRPASKGSPAEFGRLEAGLGDGARLPIGDLWIIAK